MLKAILIAVLSLLAGRSAYGQSYVVFVSTAAGASKDYVTLFNAVGSGRVLTLGAIYASPVAAAAVTGLVIPSIVSLVSTPGTTCTALPVTKTDSAYPAVPSQITALSNCTTDAVVTADIMACAVDGEEARSGTTVLCWKRNGAPYVLREGQGIMVKNTALASTGVVSYSIEFWMRSGT